MADNLANIRNYQIQLQQVETGLINDPENEDLLKLQVDLTEVINLTMQLMDKDELAALEANESYSRKATHNYKAGDYVWAPWSEDGQFYEAQIEDITSDGQCTVMFNHNKKRISEVCLVELLKPLGKKRSYNISNNSNSNKSANSLGYNAKNIGIVSSKSASSYSSFGGEGGSSDQQAGASNNMNNFKRAQETREQQKHKQQKRKEKQKQLEEEREKDKMKWQSFASKVHNKKLKGSNKKSIFATPESVHGRVGVGTCGLGGKPMTEYSQIEKVKKSSTILPKLSLKSDDDYHSNTTSSSSSSSSAARSHRNRF